MRFTLRIFTLATCLASPILTAPMAQASSEISEKLKIELAQKLVETTAVMAKAIEANAVCDLGVTHEEIMSLLKRVARLREADRRPLQPEEVSFLQSAMKDYLPWRLFTHGVDLNRFDPPQNLKLVGSLLEGAAPFRLSFASMGNMPVQLPFQELGFQPEGVVWVEWYNENKNELVREAARWNFRLGKPVLGPEEPLVTVNFRGEEFVFSVSDSNPNHASLTLVEVNGKDLRENVAALVFAQYQIGCGL